ncbi:protein-disulfide reductase DsbD domain-containing protein [uncultured Algibacter sp.]|uniref:protein-disulfide reductase DsbD domain-containing protein n=1 Tax=uncultured Algibacter sp. TaxID=298659 RepID=UPI00262C8F8C|nr:protein-disulfide reductase DsbD domain-containing protein [uncultured Algibacter sp.]
MKNIFLSIFIFISAHAFSQILEPVKWSTDVKKISSTEYELIAIATIDEKWHLYSQNVPEGGPIPTVFTFVGNPNYLKKGNTKEEIGITVDDLTFNMRVTYFENKTTFKQRIKVKKKPPFSIASEVQYMVCDDAKCIMPEPENLTFNIQ